MHELSIATRIVEIALEQAARRGGIRIDALHLKVGVLSGVVGEALLFAWEVACQGTPLAQTRLIIEEGPAVIYCPVCKAERQLLTIQKFVCPVCETPTAQVQCGRELEVVALEVAA
ncbi:MAG: hydrogenase maturation nickel metallochaperone HypA [Acidobacteriota bacterium]